MVRLGYDRYGAQGGDWGAAVTTAMGLKRGNCVGIHINMPLALPPAGMGSPTPEEHEALNARERYEKWDAGYMKQQSTRPQTLGYGLVDSPVGQMAWVVEKFLVLDGLRRPPGERADQGRASRQRDDVLGHRIRRVIGPAVLGELQLLRQVQSR